MRHPDDIALLSSLQQYYAYRTGRAAPGQIRYLYTDLADPETPFGLARLLHHRHLDAFCLNDTASAAEVVPEQAALLADFLPAYLPFPSRWELTVPRTGTMPIAAVAGAGAPPRTPVVARQSPRSPQTGSRPDRTPSGPRPDRTPSGPGPLPDRTLPGPATFPDRTLPGPAKPASSPAPSDPTHA